MPYRLFTTHWNMDTFIVWAIIILFYAPLHYLMPMLIVFFRNADDAELLRKRLIATAIDCSISMTFAFGLVIFLAGKDMFISMVVLLFSMFTPYVRLLLRKPQTV